MTITTGLSGNEIYCLNEVGLAPGNIVVGNSVHSLGFLGSIGSSLKAMAGGEIKQITSLIEEGRAAAFARMEAEAEAHQGAGIAGVTSELIFQGSNVEFLSVGSAVHRAQSQKAKPFSSSDDGQQLYAQLDVGFEPITFAFGNVAYSMGIGRGILGGLKSLGKGEVKEYSDIFNHTRHLALLRIKEHARLHQANAVLGIKTTILPFGGVCEMVMIGTASKHPSLTSSDMMTSGLNNIELWNLAKLGYMPQSLVLGTSVHSLGVVGGLMAGMKSFVRGEISDLTKMIYAAREHALGIINDEAKNMGADDIVGVKTYLYDLGGGLIEFLAIGTAVKKTNMLKPKSEQILPQAIINSQDMFFDTEKPGQLAVNINSAPKGKRPPGLFIAVIFFIIILTQVFHLIGHN
jgi:uncharacterized protein YbjQ (UPF0145 family)